MIPKRIYRLSASVGAALLCACSVAPSAPRALCPPPPTPAPIVRNTSDTDTLTDMLAYQAAARQMSAPELGRALAEQARQRPSASLLLHRAMLLAAQKGNGDLLRAQNLLDGMIADAPELKALAQSLATGYAEARKQDETVDRLGAQLREAQRRNEQLNDKLEALKSIERTLSVRPPVTGAAAK